MDGGDSPAYLRLRDTLARAILEGRYGAGDALPSVRALAAEHGLNPLTVAKAYQTFQDDGLVVVRRGVGMFVADDGVERLRAQAREQFLTRTWPDVAHWARLLDLDLAELLAREPA